MSPVRSLSEAKMVNMTIPADTREDKRTCMKVDHHIPYNYPRTLLGSMSEISRPYFFAKCKLMSSGVNIMVARLLCLFLGYMIST